MRAFILKHQRGAFLDHLYNYVLYYRFKCKWQIRLIWKKKKFSINFKWSFLQGRTSIINEDVFQLWMRAYLRLLFLKNKNNNNNIVNETDTYLHEIS